MAYNTEDLYKMALKIIKEREVRTIEGVIALMPCSKPTFYDHFPVESDEFNSIKRELNKKKVEGKERLIRMMGSITHGSPAERIFLYKLWADKEEKEAIYDTSIKAKIETPRHEITLNLIKDDEQELIEGKKDEQDN
jgi:hypothetical protein